MTVALLILGVAVSVISIVVTVSEINLMDRALAGDFVNEREREDSAGNVRLFARLDSAVYVATVVAFAMWLYRASSNLKPLAATGQRFSPGWSVGWWFVPIMNLWRPYQAMKEIWRGSDPDTVGDKDGGWGQASVWGWLGWWWAVWVIGGFVGWSNFKNTWTAQTPQEIKTADQWDISAEVLFIVAGVLAIFLVKAITARQEEKYQTVERRRRVNLLYERPPS